MMKRVAVRSTPNNVASARKAVTIPVTKRMANAGLATILAFVMNTSANAAEVVVNMGGTDGSLEFTPSVVKIHKGDRVKFVNRGGGSHNVVFEDVPDGVNPDSLSHDDLTNSVGDSFTVAFDTEGAYKYNCEPHHGAGMQGEVIVS